MDIKKTYSYFLKDYFKTTGIVYLVFSGVTLLIAILSVMLGEHFALNDIRDLIPNYFIVGLVTFIVSIIFNRNSDLISNQFGRSRETAFFSNLLVFLSLAIVFAFIFSLLKMIFFQAELDDFMRYKSYFSSFRINDKELMVGAYAKYANRGTLFLYNLTYYSYIAFAFSVVATFVYSLWVRLEVFYRWVVFLFVPIGISFIIPRFVIMGMNDPNRIMIIVDKITRFFGLQNGFSYQYVLVSTLVILIPLLIVSFFIMRKKPLYGKKK